MDWRVIVKGSIEGDVGLDGKDHRLGSSLFQLEERLSLSVPSEVLPLFVQTGEEWKS